MDHHHVVYLSDISQDQQERHSYIEHAFCSNCGPVLHRLWASN